MIVSDIALDRNDRMDPCAGANDWRLQSMHHVGLTVSDIERSIGFYRDLLGLTLIRRRDRVDQAYVGQQTGFAGLALSAASLAVSSDAGTTLEIVQYLNHAGPPAQPATNRAGTSHLCFTVTDLPSACASLKQKGVPFKSDPVRITAGPNQGGQVVYFQDPDGYTLELFEPPPSPDVKESDSTGLLADVSRKGESGELPLPRVSRASNSQRVGPLR